MAGSIFVIGTSAGGVEALSCLVAQLPRDFPSPVLIAMHLSPDHRSHLPEILQRCCLLPVLRPHDGENFKAGHVYVAAPNLHMVIDGDRVRMSSGPKENRHRPSADVLFRSAARVFGPRATGIVLTGALDDGTAGLYAIKLLGGTAIVQDPVGAFIDGMPRSAIANVDVDHVLRLEEMGAMMVKISESPMAEDSDFEVPQGMDCEVAVALGENGRMREVMNLGEYTPFTCPDCHGALVKILEGPRIVRFRCHTGHAFTIAHLLAELTQKNEDSIMNALRSLEETELLLMHIAEHLPGDNLRIRGKLEHVKGQAALVKEAAMTNEVLELETLEKE